MANAADATARARTDITLENVIRGALFSSTVVADCSGILSCIFPP